MSNAATKSEYEEKRRQIRRPLTGDLTGALVATRSGSVVPCVAVDVSRGGLRIVLSLDLTPSTPLALRLDGREVPLAVVWCAKEPAKKGYFACGLKCLDASIDLERLFTRVGWLERL